MIEATLNYRKNVPCLDLFDSDERRALALYCGHTFCLECLLQHSEKEVSGEDVVCPFCFSKFCLELVGEGVRRDLELDRIYGVGEKALAPKGPRALTFRQLKVECISQGISILSTEYALQ